MLILAGVVVQPEFTEARRIAGTKLKQDAYQMRFNGSRRGGRRTARRGLAQRGRGGSLSSNGRGNGRDGVHNRVRPVARIADHVEPSQGVVVQSSPGHVVDYNSEEIPATLPQTSLPLVLSGPGREASRTHDDMINQVAGVQVSQVRPPHLHTLEPLPEPIRGIVRRVMEIMDNQYGAPDSVTRDRMLAMGIRVAIEMALHFDVGILVFLVFLGVSHN